MSQLFNKLFRLNQLRLAPYLLISVLIAAATFFADRYYDPENQFWLTVCYILSFVMAVAWGIANYMAHIRMNAKFRKLDHIGTYVEQLSMSREDKLELQNYLEDLAEDLMSQGKSREQASKEAISQFKVKEFLSFSKSSMIFELNAHYYLLGWAIAACFVFIVLGAVGSEFFPSSVVFIVVETILFAYGIGFVGLFAVYKLLDRLIYQKLYEYFS